jgi:hypothetical protein
LNSDDTVTASATFPVPEYLDYREQVGPKRQLWENNGWSIRGRDGDRDYLLWASPYLVQGVEGGTYRAGQFALDQTLLITAPVDRPDELHDNDFIAIGWDPRDHRRWDELEVSGGDEAVTWRTPDRTYRIEPGSFTIGGRHAGVRTEITTTLAAPPMWFTDPSERFNVRANRWWIASGDAQGLIRVSREDIHVIDAHAVHERHIHLGRVHDPVRLLAGGGVCWYTASSEDVRVAILARPSFGSAWAQVSIGQSSWEVTHNAISIAEAGTWLDPQTGMLVPQAWRLGIALPDGTEIDMRLSARARAYYTWDFLVGGQTMLYWWLCSGSAEIRSAGPTRRLADLTAEAHLNRTFSTRHDGQDGA